jgi:hypothetical protein
MTLDRQPAAFAERRLDARAIHVMMPAMTSTPSRIQSQMNLVLDPLLGADGLLTCAVGGGVVALEVDGTAVGVAVTLGLGAELELGLGAELELRLGEMLILRLGDRLAMTFLAVLPHPAAMNVTTRMDVNR